MAACPHCSTEIPSGSRYCPGCGAIQSSVSQMATAVAPGTPSSPRSPSLGPVGRLESSVGFGGAAFQLGQILSGRYRVIGLLGRGGMGEVYRADDLELSQAVALKFLGRSLAERPDSLERFRAEVRNARQVSHPNICRVYDIGEAEGQTFLSMEFVDGEDLGTLLKRIGRLPRAKADQVARQLCAGLAAAHDRGVIHRDLKPSNVMIDGEGRVRVTDFGLAVRPADGGSGELAGTPAYMAPEQFDGGPATVQSDLYSLGLILYEVYTGHRALEATTWDGWKSQHSQTEPRSPEKLERDVDEAVARAILRCLEKDPAKRPRSALQLAASLPGGDPMAAALAAGETPSPQMVADSGGEGALAARSAWALLAGFLALLAALLALAPAAEDLGLAPLTASREVLEARARDIVSRIGYTEQPRDRASWFSRDYERMLWRSKHEVSTHWRRDYAAMGPPLLLFYRQSPRLMAPAGEPTITPDDPALAVSGMVSVVVEASGRLRELAAVPPELDSTVAAPGPATAADLFSLAGLDTTRFHEVSPVWVPLSAFDERREWLGTGASRDPSASAGQAELRVSAAWWRGRPVAFSVRGPWAQPTRMSGARVGTRNPVTAVVAGMIILLMLVVAGVTGRARLASGRGDWRGGLRLGGFILGCNVLHWVFATHHTPDFGHEAASYAIVTGIGLVQACFLFFLYLAVEPYVRRRTPELLISWARVLQGRFRDPRVGRDVLLGSVFGGVAVLILFVVNALPTWVPFRGQTPIPPVTQVMNGGGDLLGVLVGIPIQILVPTLSVFGVWFLLRLLLKHPLAAAVGLAAIMTALALGAENPVLEVPGALLQGVIAAWLITRHGLLALVAAQVMRTLLVYIPMPFSFASPYAIQAVICMLAVLATLLWSFRTSLGGRPAFALALDD